MNYKLVYCCSGAPQNVYLEAIIDNLTITSTEQGEDRNENSHSEIILEPHLGQKITLTCLELNNGTVPNPVPEFTFLKNGIPLSGLGRGVHNSITLLAKSDESFSCEAENKMGNKLSNTIDIRVQRKFFAASSNHLDQLICFFAS